MGKFKTLKTTSTSFYKEKGSKFYGYAFPINTIEDSKTAYERVFEEHPKARHICTALLLGSGDNEYYLLDDAGEPSNSAAAPMLGQIRSHEITNVYLIVVRYFGGTKLGIGGLISAYKTTASQAIENNIIITVEPQSSLTFEVDYEALGDILSVIDRNNLKVTQEHNNKGVKITLQCKSAELAAIKDLFAPYGISFL